jgi:hypothetical protein
MQYKIDSKRKLGKKTIKKSKILLVKSRGDNPVDFCACCFSKLVNDLKKLSDLNLAKPTF